SKAPGVYPVFPAYEQGTYDFIAASATADLEKVCLIADKQERQSADDEVKDRVKAEVAAAVEAGTLPASAAGEVSGAYKSLTKKIVRDRVLTEGVRMDGRGLADIRPLDAEVQVIPRVHGSAIFQRGETQIMGVTTLNMLKMESRSTRCLRPRASATCTTTTSRPTRPVRPAVSVRRSVVRSGTASWPSVRSCRCCPAAKSSPTRSVRCLRLSA